MTQDSQKHLRISRTETCVVETVGIGVETLRNTYELVVLKQSPVCSADPRKPSQKHLRISRTETFWIGFVGIAHICSQKHLRISRTETYWDPGDLLCIRTLRNTYELVVLKQKKMRWATTVPSSQKHLRISRTETLLR